MLLELISGAPFGVLSRGQLYLSLHLWLQLVGDFSQRQIIVSVFDGALLLANTNDKSGALVLHLGEQFVKIRLGVHDMNCFKVTLPGAFDSFDCPPPT